MDMLGSILGSILTETARATYSTVISTIRFGSNKRALNSGLNSLTKLTNEVDTALKNFEIESKSSQAQARRWLNNVEEIVSRAKSIQEERVSCALFLKCKRSRKLATILEEVKRLENLGKELVETFSEEGAFERVEYIPGSSMRDQITASQMLVRITESLMTDGVQKIGVWGMGGVGKTTLVRTLNNKLRKEDVTQPFGLVIWATVSKDFDMRKIQTQIAERMNIDVKTEDTEEKLARLIYRRLEKVKNFLLILDDVWKPIDLDFLGIPRTEDHKVVVTSRFLEVCRTMRTDVDITVDCLCEEEAWELFCLNAGEVARSDHIETVAKQVSSECGGLPLAIVTVGRALRGKKNVKQWKHALNELRRSVPWVKSIEEKIYQPLKLSYDSLEDKMKLCFLFCALFPEDYSIDLSELVKCWMAEGFLDEQYECRGFMNKGITWAESLKDSCLLEDGARDATVKMHDVVRDFAIWVMSSSKHEGYSIVMPGTGLREVSKDKFVHSIKRVSLMNNKLEGLPNFVVECPGASVLLLQSNYHLREIPIMFLQAFPALRILNLSGTRISSLPQSLSLLRNLQALVLRDCYHLEELPSLEEVVKLQILDLCATCIRESPKGLEALDNLRDLDLSRTRNLESFPAGTICRLSSLEALDMTQSLFSWHVKGEAEDGQATFEEITCLRNLRVLSITLVSIPPLSSEMDSWIKGLKKFQLFIGPAVYISPTRRDKRRITVSKVNISQASIGWLLANVTSLVLNQCGGLNTMLAKLATTSKSSFKSIKSLTIEGRDSSLSPTSRCATQLDLLPNLEELHLRQSNLGSIDELRVLLRLKLQKLKLLEVSMCRSLRFLLNISDSMPSLPDLEEIQVSFCDKFEQLFHDNRRRRPQAFSSECSLPKLRVLKLTNLQRLVRLSTFREAWTSLEEVEVMKCYLLNDLFLTSESADTIREIRGEPQWWRTLYWKDDATRESLQRRFVPIRQQPTIETFHM